MDFVCVAECFVEQVSATVSVLLVEETEAGVKISTLKCFPASTLIPLSKH